MRELRGVFVVLLSVLSSVALPEVVTGVASPTVGNVSEIIPNAMHASLLRNSLSESLVT